VRESESESERECAQVFRCEENQVDKVPRNVGLMTRDKSQMWHALCQKGLLWRSEKERKREKKSEKERKREKKSEKERKSRQKRENLNSFVFFFSSEFFVLSRLSLSDSLSDAFLKEQTP